jgi:uncharacterized protein (DUF885 family)
MRRVALGIALLIAVAHAHADSRSSDALLEFLDATYVRMLANNPSMATAQGDATGNDRWEDLSDRGLAADAALARRELKTLQRRFDLATLDAPAQLQYRVFVAQQQLMLDRYAWRNHLYPLNQIVGPHVDVPRTLVSQAVQSAADARAYVRRVHATRPHLAGLMARLDTQARQGIYLPKSIYPILLSQARGVIAGAPHGSNGESPILSDFRRKLAALEISAADRDALEASLVTALRNDLQPAYQQLITQLEAHAAKTPIDAGVWQLPRGAEFYSFLLRQFTTTDISAERVHELGLAEVARVQEEMRTIMREVGHTGDLRSFMQQLKTDPRFFMQDDAAGRAAYLERARGIVANMQARLSEVFVAPPPLRLEVRATEAYRAAGAPSGFYEAGTPDGRRPGTVYLNLERLDTRPLYDLEWLLYHEALPGHHLQISTILVDRAVPRLRKVNRWWQDTAFVEGWGLYAERLAREMGFYQDPYSNFGRLSGELWRATRLVVDSGLHAKRWSREQAIQYLDDHTPSPRSSNEQAVDRYLAVPGQATAFTVGMLQILEERARAQRELGQRFDLREFHATLLRSGYLPLWAMRENVTTWIASQNAAAAH